MRFPAVALPLPSVPIIQSSLVLVMAYFRYAAASMVAVFCASGISFAAVYLKSRISTVGFKTNLLPLNRAVILRAAKCSLLAPE